MRALKTLPLVAALCLAGILASPHRAQAEPNRTLTGELVAIDGSPTHFRIVGQNGTFVAPSGTTVTALDGHNVEVEVANGHVASITEVHVPIAPVTHGVSTVRGELVVADALGRRFSFAGDTQTYVAPPTIADIAPYAGKMVEITLDDTGQVTDFRLLPPGAVPAPASLNTYPSNGYAVATTCSYRGEAFTAGAAVCQAGTQYRCDGTTWRSLGTSCVSGDAMHVSLPSPRECEVGGATVASGSGVCRGGTTYRCDDGTWINAQTACR